MIRDYRHHTNPFRTASSLRADMIFGRDKGQDCLRHYLLGGSAICLSVTDAPDFVGVFYAGDDEAYALVGRGASNFAADIRHCSAVIG
jgi:hypothetical protein